MRKLIPVLLLVILSVALCACSGTDSTNGDGYENASGVAVEQVELSVDSLNKNFFISYFDFAVTNVSGDGKIVKLVDEYSNFSFLKSTDACSFNLQSSVKVSEGQVGINIKLGLYVDAFTVEAPCYQTFEGTYYTKAENGEVKFYKDSNYLQEASFDFSFVDYPITSTKNFSDSYEVGIVVRY